MRAFAKKTAVLIFVMMAVQATAAEAGESLEYSLARGGRLYDNWFKENGAGTPGVPNPAYPEEGKYKGDKGSDWRCKECHGWDYLGKEGAYGSGKHHTGIVGIHKARGMEAERIIEILRGMKHGYSETMLTDRDARDLAEFVAKGQTDMDQYIDRAARKARGSSSRGQSYYQTICVKCHGLDGKALDTPPLGEIANSNPWEVLHKILNGQPGEQMPALRALDIQIVVDILAYMQDDLPSK